MKTRILVNKKHFMMTFVCVIAVLIATLFFSSKIIVYAAFSGYSSELTCEELHVETIATTVNPDAPAITFLTHGLGGGVDHWSNTMYRNEDNEWIGSSTFSHDSDSIND